MTGYLRIGGALILGVLIVLAAFTFGNKNTGVAQVNELQVAESRSYISPTDSDGDGTPDWEEDLGNSLFDTIAAGTTTTASTTNPYEAPTTFTGKFAEAFFQDYMNGKMQGADLSDPSKFVDEAVTAIEKNTATKIYTSRDISIIEDSDSDIRDYGNAVASIIMRYPGVPETEMTILNRALTENNPAALEGLEALRQIYENYTKDTQSTPVPKSFAQQHIALITAFNAIETDIIGMQGIFDDPLYGLARIKRYEDDVRGMYIALHDIYTMLQQAGVVYEKTEPGDSLYVWSTSL